MNQSNSNSELPKIAVLLEDVGGFVALVSARFSRRRGPLPAMNFLEQGAFLGGENFEQRLPECTIVVGDPASIRLHLHKAPKVQWVQSSFAGVEPLLDLTYPAGCQITALKSGFGPLISEYVFGNLICHLREFELLKAQQAMEHWQLHHYTSLAQLTLTVIGLGDIGKHVAATAQHFGMRVLGVNRSGESSAPLDGIFPVQDLSKALAQSDVVVLALPATDKTRNLLDAAAFASMKRGSYLFNVGRGWLVDDAELLRALDNGTLAHAWLDVFKSEPLPTGHPYWLHPKVNVTPHMAAVTFTDTLADYFADNLMRWMSGKPLHGLVDLARGY